MMITKLLFAVLIAASSEQPLPISAHNCYSGMSNDRLNEAIALGIDNIEIDLGWDHKTKQLFVGHDDKPAPGAKYPDFEAYLQPILSAKARPDGAPRILTLDWKTSHPEAVARVKSFLDSHADIFSSATKTAKSVFTERRITVCFTGSDEAKEIYDRLVPQDGAYRAFRDRVYGGSDYRQDPTAYIDQPASAYHRFLTCYWGVIERGGPPSSGAWTPEEEKRLKTLVDAAHRGGYRVRFYCLNGGGSLTGLPYRFPTQESARIRWRAAARAGVDWVASDNYAEIVHTLRPREE